MDIISIVLAVFALIISILSIILNKISTSTQMGLLEIETYRLINDTVEKIMDITLVMLDHKDLDDRNVIQKLLVTAIENNLNAYEEACAKYIDKKIHKERFEKNYKIAIQQLIQSFPEKFAINSSYNCIKRVHNDWFNPEK